MTTNERPERIREILALRELGYDVKKLTEFQFRINNCVDLYPTHRRFHHLGSEQRGRYQSARQCVDKWLAWEKA